MNKLDQLKFQRGQVAVREERLPGEKDWLFYEEDATEEFLDALKVLVQAYDEAIRCFLLADAQRCRRQAQEEVDSNDRIIEELKGDATSASAAASSVLARAIRTGRR